MKNLKLYQKIVFATAIVLIVALTVSTVLLSLSLSKKDEPTYYEKKCNMFELENVNFSHGQIVFIGDSITDGCALDTFYPGLPLAVYNRGIGGDNSEGVLNRLKLSLFDIKPSKIVLMIGVNDINGKRSNERILNAYEEILKSISANLPTAEVFCISILPVNDTLSTYTSINVDESNAQILSINPEIKRLADKYGYKFVDMYPEFADENNKLIEALSPDGIHLNSEGYKVYSKKLTPLLLQES